MAVVLLLLAIAIYFSLALIGQKNTGTTPSFDDLGKATLMIIFFIGFFFLMFTMLLMELKSLF